MNIGVVGLGYWGPNIARNMARVGNLTWCCDLSQENRDRFAAQYPQTRFTADLDELLADPEVDAVAVATSVPTHHPVGLAALAAGKHVFIEKPLAASVEQARELVEAAESSGRTLMVGHLLLFHPGLRAVKELISSGQLGKVYYLYGNRQNLGKVRADENALWSLGAHDVAVLLDLVGERPLEAWARGECYVRPGVEDVVFGYLKFPSGVIAHLHLSWLDPHKMRRLTVVGSEKMAVFDDMETDRKLTIYDKGVTPPRTDSYGENVGIRYGGISIPAIPTSEPLRIECQEFVDAITEGRTPIASGRDGLAVVEVLDAMQRSLEAGGTVVAL